MASDRLARFWGDLAGGFSAGLVSLPGNIIFGLIAFEPLGPEYLGQGVVAAMFASVFGGLVAALLGGTRAMITGPQAPTALVFGSVCGQLLASGAFDAATQAGVLTVLTLCFGMVFASGVLQAAMGLLKLGAMVKYISYPVVAGLLNGTVLLIAAGQLGPLVGLPGMGFWDVFSHLDGVRPLSCLVAVVVMVLMLSGRRLPKSVPAPLVGLLGGTGVYWGLMHFGYGDGLGPTLSAVPQALPTLDNLYRAAAMLGDPSWHPLASVLFTGAASIVLLGSMDTLVSSVTLQNLTNSRSDTNRELVAQGLGNMANGMFGATAGGGFLGRSMVNIQAGGSTRLSPVVCALTVFLVVVVLGRYLAWVPASGMAGLVMAVGVLLVDRWSLRLAAKLFSAKVANRREILTNLGIVVLVMAVAVYRDIMAAAGTGVALSVLVFVGQMGQSVVRRNYGGDKVRSLKRRAGELQRLLTEHGRAIQVFELMGPVFFGSTDGLIDMVDDRVDRGARWIILDMRYVTRMDATGANVLAQTAGRLDRQGVRLLISSTSRDSMTCQMMRDMGLDESLCVDRVFESTDEALEWCEDELLVSLGMSPEGEPLLEARVLLERLGFDEEHSLALAGYLVREEYEVGETVCRMGESGDSMYFIAQGLVDVLLVLEGGRRKRVHTLATGTVFGEMSLLEGKPRSADILVRERMVCYSMDQAGLDRMVANQPQTAVSLLSFLARTVAGNLRHSNEMISELEK